MAAKQEKEMLQRKLKKDLSHDDKLDNVKRSVGRRGEPGEGGIRGKARQERGIGEGGKGAPVPEKGREGRG